MEGSYLVRSLYFDTLDDEALVGKLHGDTYREKFRIRYYNQDPTYIVLEKKAKIQGKCKKEKTPLSLKEAMSIGDGRLSCLKQSLDPIKQEFYAKHRTRVLRPKVVVEYEREAFVHPLGNVRITLDYNMKSSVGYPDLFEERLPLVRTHGDYGVLEVKYDSFLPRFLRDLLQVPRTRTCSHSKYLISRLLYN